MTRSQVRFLPGAHMTDLTVTAIPGFAATIAAEQRWLARRASQRGPTPADYENKDSRASLTMGTLSLLAPFVLPKLVAPFAPKGKLAKRVLGLAVASAAVTTIADLIERRAATVDAGNAHDKTDEERRGVPQAPLATDLSPRSRALRRVRSVSAPVAIVSGGLTVAGAWRSMTSRHQLFTNRIVPDLGDGPIPFAIAMLGWDFIYYWNHRFMHEARYMWAIHVVHHSSERYNLTTALRQPVADVFGTFIPDGLLCALGVRPSLVERSRAINLLYQYWIHTDTIRTLGPVESIFNTPSHHRAHHGSNQQYLDRNHAGILIVWDRLFGTFEREEETVAYGLTKNIKTFNPARIATHEYRDILRDAGSARNWHDRLSFVIRGPGWAYAQHRERTSGVS